MGLRCRQGESRNCICGSTDSSDQEVEKKIIATINIGTLEVIFSKGGNRPRIREIRLSNQNPEVLILSARDQTRDRITGLQLGSDDYLVKPFAFDELHARIQALVRRKYRVKSPLIIIGNLHVDTSRGFNY
ncbi:MAG: response regulator [Proteobacteria bacterium]|nr:response regulator [Pseudomonadota bacterium]